MAIPVHNATTRVFFLEKIGAGVLYHPFSPLIIHNKIINIRSPNIRVFFINTTSAKKFVEFSI
jgi:hypothetical protein